MDFSPPEARLSWRVLRYASWEAVFPISRARPVTLRYRPLDQSQDRRDGWRLRATSGSIPTFGRSVASLCGSRRRAEHRNVGSIDQYIVPFVRQHDRKVQRGIEVVFPNFTRQVVQQLHAIAVGIVNIEA